MTKSTSFSLCVWSTDLTLRSLRVQQYVTVLEALSHDLMKRAETKCTQEDVRRSVTESIERLGYIPDLILLHNPFLAGSGKSVTEFYGYVEELVKDGTLKGCSLGLSNFR